MPQRHLELLPASYARNRLVVRYRLDGFEFGSASFWNELDFHALERRVGRDPLERIVFHITLIDALQTASLGARTLSCGKYARFVTAEVVELTRTLVTKIWAQWRYEHDQPDYRGPEFIDPIQPSCGPVASLDDADAPTLLFFGGGKDSLVSARLLERAEEPFATLSYSSSIYGSPAIQHRLVDRVLDGLPTTKRLRQWVSDDFSAAPVDQLMPEYGAKHVLAAETPASIFGALPLALEHGYRSITLGHEHSANVGNLIWNRTGEDVNHQWGKSIAAERLMANYIQTQLVSGCEVYSILQPIHDVLIFELLAEDSELATRTHSCNEHKPWCHRCAKCAYVALGFAAHLPSDAYTRTFTENVLDLPENLEFYRQMVGLGSHTPFECIGEIDESRLALALCAARSDHQDAIRNSRAVRMFREEIGSLDVGAILARYTELHLGESRLPTRLESKIRPILENTRARARARIENELSQCSPRQAHEDSSPFAPPIPLSPSPRANPPVLHTWVTPKARKGVSSRIEGDGVFATQPIARGEVVEVKAGHIVDRSTLRALPERLQNSEIGIAADLHLVALHDDEYDAVMLYLNHSCEPNVGLDGNIVFVAMRDIDAGEELTIDYAMIDDDPHGEVMDCRCGTASCRGTITGQDWRRKDLQQRYGRFFSSYIRARISIS